MVYGSWYGKSRDDPTLRPFVPGDRDWKWRILSVTEPQYDEHLKQWFVDYTKYLELDPCPCCGQPRGAGSLHP